MVDELPSSTQSFTVRLAGATAQISLIGPGSDDFIRYLGEVKSRMLDLREPFNAWRPVAMDHVRAVFEAEGIPRWPDLSPGYEAWKRKNYPGQPMGRLTDRMYESFTDPGSPDMIWDVGPQSIQYGSQVPYWRRFDFKRPISPEFNLATPKLAALVAQYVVTGRSGETGPEVEQ